MQNIIKKIITNQATSDLNKLYDEGALISRLCCKVKKKFRGEKLFKRLKQVFSTNLEVTIIFYIMYSILFEIILDFCCNKKITSTKYF